MGICVTSFDFGHFLLGWSYSTRPNAYRANTFQKGASPTIMYFKITKTSKCFKIKPDRFYNDHKSHLSY